MNKKVSSEEMASLASEVCETKERPKFRKLSPVLFCHKLQVEKKQAQIWKHWPLGCFKVTSMPTPRNP